MSAEAGGRFSHGEDIEGIDDAEAYFRSKEYEEHGDLAGKLRDIRSLLAKVASRLDEVSMVLQHGGESSVYARHRDPVEDSAV